MLGTARDQIEQFSPKHLLLVRDADRPYLPSFVLNKVDARLVWRRTHTGAGDASASVRHMIRAVDSNKTVVQANQGQR